MKHFIILLLLCLPFAAHAQEDAPPPIQEGDVLPYLEQVIALQRAAADTELAPDNAREALLKDRLQDNSKKLLDKSLEFARAQAAIFASAAPQTDAAAAAPEAKESRHARLLKAMNDADQRVADLNAQLASSRLAPAAREKLSGDLKLAKAQQDLIQTMLGIFAAESNGSGALIDQINSLSRSAAEEAPDQPASAAAAKDQAAAKPRTQDDSTQDDGMLTLVTSMFSYSHKETTVDNLSQQVKALTEKNTALSASIRASLRAAIAEGNALSAENTSDPKSLAAYHKSLGVLLARYKQLGGTIVPIGQMNVILDSADRNLQEWHKLIDDDWSRVFRKLLLRLVVLSVAVAIPLVGSSLAHRATLRYVKDPKRQRQLNIVRRIVLAGVLTFVILANFISEFGSLATFAGFITAGLAVALQTVLVSLVAHFFFFGRYGVRAGDRITVADVTGDVIQVGILRLYMRELKETDNGLVASGKVVAFPNSILFQPTAFYKYMDDFK